jgi:hypothetical protein
MYEFVAQTGKGAHRFVVTASSQSFKSCTPLEQVTWEAARSLPQTGEFPEGIISGKSGGKMRVLRRR